jgi:hypothetical protein
VWKVWYCGGKVDFYGVLLLYILAACAQVL